MHSRSIYILLFVMVIAALYQVPFAHADQKLYDEFSISTTPDNPAPGQDVVVEVKSLSSDTAHASIAWYNGTTLIKKGTGLTQITVTAPSNNKPLTINAKIVTSDGKTAVETTTLHVGEVNMAWEALNYVPPLYRGRALYTYQSSLKIVALPNLRDAAGKTIDPTDLIYTWKKDSTVLGSLSGYGKQSLILTGDAVARPYSVTVEVDSRDGTVKGQGYITVDATTPEITLYEEDPLYGILYNKALVDQFALSTEKRIVAEPYYFSVVAKDAASLRYTWSINRLEQTDLAGDTAVTLRPKGDIEGASAITIRIDNLREILQSASSDINAYFSKKQQTDLPTF